MSGTDPVIAVIAGRGGSKGLPRKNVRDLAGKPLIAWSIEAAAQSKCVNRIIISTDDEEIASVARKWGADVPFLRPPELATDEAPIIDCLLHAADNLAERYRYVVLLQATSPLRLPSDIDNAVNLCRDRAAPACISVTPAPKAIWALEMKPSGQLISLFPNAALRRQETLGAYMPNGAVYVAELEWLRNCRNFYSPETVGYVMPPERSIDIDCALDLLVAESILNKGLTP